MRSNFAYWYAKNSTCSIYFTGNSDIPDLWAPGQESEFLKSQNPLEFSDLSVLIFINKDAEQLCLLVCEEFDLLYIFYGKFRYTRSLGTRARIRIPKISKSTRIL